MTAALPFMTVKGRRHVQAVARDGRGDDRRLGMLLLVNPNDENDVVYVGTLGGVTFPEETIAAVGHATHIAPVLVHRGEGYASLSKIALEYEGGGEMTWDTPDWRMDRDAKLRGMDARQRGCVRDSASGVAHRGGVDDPWTATRCRSKVR